MKPDVPLKIKPPKTLGACIDLLYAWEGERAEVTRRAEQLKAREQLLETHILDTFSKADLNGAAGRVAKINVIRTEVPQVEGDGVGWPKLYAYIVRKKAFDLLQKRLSTSAVRERWAARIVVPGVSKFTVVTLSVTKR